VWDVGSVLVLLGDSLLLSALQISSLDVSVAATSRVSEVRIFIRCRQAAPDPMDVGAAVVSADWLAHSSLWEASIYAAPKEYNVTNI
jgi:hypothetical protein